MGNLDTMRRQLAAAANPGDATALVAKLTKPLDASIARRQQRGAADASLAGFLPPPAARAVPRRCQPAGLGHARHAEAHARRRRQHRDRARRGRLAHVRRSPSVGERAAQSRAERQGCHAEWRLPDDRDGQHLSGRRLCAPVRRRRCRAICRPLRHRHRNWNPQGHPRSRLRAVLHHQACRRRLRPRPRHGARLRQAVGRPYAHL